MNIKESRLWPDIEKVLQDGRQVTQEVSCILHTPDADIPIYRLLSVDIDREYRRGYTDKISVQLVMPLGDFVALIYPQTETNEETDVYDVFMESTLKTTTAGAISEVRYRAWLPPESYAGLIPETLIMHSQDRLNQTAHEFTIQLTSLSTEPLMLLKTQSVFRSDNRQTLLTDLLTYAVNQLTVNGLPPVDVVEVSPVDNDAPVSEIIIKTGTKTVELPYLLQSVEGGLYKSGIGSYVQYFQDKIRWFIYPLYNPLVYKTERSRAVLYLLDNRFTITEVESTYRVTGKLLHIVAGMSQDDMEVANKRRVNRPLSMDITDADLVLDHTVNESNGKLLGTGDQVHKTVSIVTRPDQVPISVSDNRTTNNYYAKSSELFKNNGYIIGVMWGNSRADLLKPGMGFSVYTETAKGIRQRYATLLHNHTIKRVLGGGADAKSVQSNTYMSLFIER